MRPLTLPVQLEAEQEEDGDQFVLNLPDGTSQKQVFKFCHDEELFQC